MFTRFYLLLLFIVVTSSQDCESSFKVNNCSNGTGSIVTGELLYELSATSNSSKICPRSDSDVPQWRISILLNSTIIIGTFCSNTTFNTSNVCTSDEGILVIKNEQFLGENGDYKFSFVSANMDIEYSLEIRFGATAVQPFNSSVKRVSEGDPHAELSWIIYSTSYNGMIQLFHNETLLSNFTVFDKSSQCTTPMSNESPTVLSVFLSNLTESSQGIYTLIAGGVMSGQNASNINLIVDPVSPLPSSTISITLTSTTSLSVVSVNDTPTNTHTSIVVSSSSSANTNGSNDSITATVVIIGASFVLFIACLVLIIIIIIMCCICYKRRQHPLSAKRRDPEGIEIIPLHNGTTNTISKPRLGSTSSERPLTQGGSSSAVNTPTSDSPLNYTAVYCSEEYSRCGQMIKEKHSDLIHIVDGEEAIRNSLVDPYCTDILLITHSIDDVVKEVMSCGIDPQRPSGREKLRFVKFVSKDDYPDRTIGVNGFKYVLIEGDPLNIDTLLQAINKAEYPELVKEYRTEDQYSKGEDHFDSPVPQAQSTPHSLPHKHINNDLTGGLPGIPAQILEEQKKTNKYLETISRVTVQNLQVNQEIQQATETIVENTQEQVYLDRENNALIEAQLVNEDSSTV